MLDAIFIASLPDASEPAVLAFGAGMGAFLASTSHRLRAQEPERELHAQRTENGTYVGFALALVSYVVTNLWEAVL